MLSLAAGGGQITCLCSDFSPRRVSHNADMEGDFRFLAPPFDRQAEGQK